MSADTPSDHLGPQAVSLAFMTAVLWGGTAVAVKYSVATLPPIAVAAIRFALAATCMLVWCRLSNCGIRLRQGEKAIALGAGLLMFVQISLFNLAILWSNSSHSMLLISTFVIWVALIEHFVTKTDRITRIKLVGLLLAAAGVVVALGSAGKESSAGSPTADTATLRGDLVMLLSSIILGIKIVYTKQAVRRIDPGRLILWHHLGGVVLFTLYSAVAEEHSARAFGDFTLPVVLGLLYQGVIVGGICFATQAVLLRKYSATRIAIFGFATPVFGVVAAVLLRGDVISLGLLASGVCVAAGIYLVSVRPGNARAGQRRAPAGG